MNNLLSVTIRGWLDGHVKLAACIWLALVVLIASVGSLLVLPKLNLDGNILGLLPKGQQDKTIEKAFEQFAEKNMRQLIFLVSHVDKKVAISSAEQLAGRLKSSEKIEEVQFKISEQLQRKLGQFNFNYRHKLLSRDDRKLLMSANFDAFSENVLEKIYSPLSGNLVDLLKVDPLLLSYRFALYQQSLTNYQTNSQQGVLNLDGQYLMANRDNRFFVMVSAKLSASPFDQNTQQEIIGELSELRTYWAQRLTSGELDAPIILTSNGALFYASYAYETARGEISTIGLGSLLLVILLIVIAFYSVRPILLVSLALGFGIVSGFILVHLLFGQVHLLTVVFGASLIGVAVDYAFHYFSAKTSEQEKHRLSKILPAISLGLVSSVIGYLSLLTTPFPGLQQMALFCIVGLIGAYLTVVLLFPSIAFSRRTSPLLLKFCQSALSFFTRGIAIRLWSLLLLFPAVALFIILNQNDNSDDIRQFQTLNDSLKESENLIKSVVNAPVPNQFYLVKASSQEALLVRLEGAEIALNELVQKDIIEGYQSISQWLPSIKRQRENYRLYEMLYSSNALQTLADYGLIDNGTLRKTKEAFVNAYRDDLLPQDWLSSPAGKPLSYLWLGKVDSVYAAVISLKGINQLSMLESIDENIVFVDKVGQVSSLFNVYRARASTLLAVALGLIFLLLSYRYKWRKAALICSSPVIAISMAVVGLFLMGESVNLFNTLALFLVVGIGIDYGLFFAESKSAEPHVLLAVLLSALTTIFSFGLLALSETPAIHAFGLTMLIGISTTFFLSPIIGQLVVRNQD